MTKLNIFRNELFEVHAKLEDGSILFNAEQVALNLGIVSTTFKNGSLYKNVRWQRVNDFLPQVAEIKKGDFIPEAMVYKLAFKASNETAEKFQDWLAIEVIPSIRKNGAYMTENTLEQAINNPDFMIGLLQNLKLEQEKLKEANSVIEAQKPKVLFADAVSTSNTSILVGQLSKLISQNGISIGQNRLFDWLRENSYLGKKGNHYNEPTQYSMDRKLFQIKERTINNPDGSVKITRTTMVTGKGQVYFINKLLKSEGLGA